MNAAYVLDTPEASSYIVVQHFVEIQNELIPPTPRHMSYLVTARKWRPMVFEDIVGQSHVTTTLRNAIASNRLSHAYIFSGPRGVGKTTTARILAKAINCRNPRELNPDNECDICREITEGRGIDVLEIDGASNRGVDEIRNLRESVRYGPAKGKYKVYIIDEVHMLTKEAFNALLKTLEEPPSYIVFVFATTEVHKVPPTILSRCQRFDFRRISTDEIVARLRFIADQEHITIDDDALLIIAKKGDGSLRDAQSIFDQMVSFCGETISAQQVAQALNVVDVELYFRTTDLIHNKDAKGGLALVEDIIQRGYDIKEFLSGLAEHFRNLLIVLTTQSTQLIETSEAYKKRYEEAAPRFSEADLFRLIKIVGDLTAALRWTDQPRFKLEVGLLQMIKMDSSVAIDQLLQQLDELKKKVGLLSPPHDFKLAGTVSASQPTRAAIPPRQPREEVRTLDQPTSSASHQQGWQQGADLSATTFKPAGNKKVEYASTPGLADRVQEATIIRIEDATHKWHALVEAASQKRVALGTLLSESQFVDYRDGTLRVGCPDDVHLSMLRRNQEFLVDLAHQIYGAKVRLETILAPPRVEKDNGEHPVITALKRELGAEPIE